jgi:hypothetical protein
MAQKLGAQSDIAASADEVRRIFGELDEARLLDILALRPTILDLENAAMGLSGDRDVFGPGEPLESVAGDIIAILTSDEEEEPARPR